MQYKVVKKFKILFKYLITSLIIFNNIFKLIKFKVNDHLNYQNFLNLIHENPKRNRFYSSR